MRLEEDEHAATRRDGAGSLERGGDLGRVVAVVVEHADAGSLAPRLEPPTDAAELREDPLGVFTRDARELERGERDRRVPPVVLARDGEVERDGVELVA